MHKKNNAMRFLCLCGTHTQRLWFWGSAAKKSKSKLFPLELTNLTWPSINWLKEKYLYHIYPELPSYERTRQIRILFQFATLIHLLSIRTATLAKLYTVCLLACSGSPTNGTGYLRRTFFSTRHALLRAIWIRIVHRTNVALPWPDRFAPTACTRE